MISSHALAGFRRLRYPKHFRSSSKTRRPASASASAQQLSHYIETFVHPVNGVSIRARVDIPKKTVFIDEPILLSEELNSKFLDKIANKASEAVKCRPAIPARMLALLAKDESVRSRVLALYDGGGVARWPKVNRGSFLATTTLESSDNTAAVAPAAAAWLRSHYPPAASVSEDDLARAAVIFSLNAHEGPGGTPALYEIGCKVSHACGSAANAASNFVEEGGAARGRRTHYALEDIRAGALITTDYHFANPSTALLSTRSRRTVIRRAKFFECLCARCSAPDPLRALPCPRCAPRDAATGCVPDSAVFLPSGGLRGKGDGPQLAVPVPLAVFEREQKQKSDTQLTPAEGQAPPREQQEKGRASSGQGTDGDAELDRFVWRCGACHGSFTEADINAASPPVAAGVTAPVPDSQDFAPLTGPTPVMELEALAERSSNEAFLNLVRAEEEAKAQGGTLATMVSPATLIREAGVVGTRARELARLVGPTHGAVAQLRLLRIKLILCVAVQAIMADGLAILADSGKREKFASVIAVLLEDDLKGPTSRRSPAGPAGPVATLVREFESVWTFLRDAGLLEPTCSEPMAGLLLGDLLVVTGVLGGLKSGEETRSAVEAMLREALASSGGTLAEPLQMIFRKWGGASG